MKRIIGYENYNSSSTIKYKGGFIFCSSFGSEEVIRVSVDAFAYAIPAKSVRAAKILITKYEKRMEKYYEP